MSDLLYNCGYYYVGGTFAGIIGTLISQPADTCKIHLQTKRPLELRTRTLNQNIKWAYRGAMPSFIGYGIEKSLVFGTYSTMCNVFELDEHNHNHTFFAGLVAGLSASLSITPAEQIKTDRQLQKKTLYTFKHLYSGIKYTSARESIGFSIYFTAYNQMSKCFNRKSEDSFPLKLAKAGIIGGFSAFIAWIPIYPIDLNKTLIQSGDGLKQLHQDLKNANYIGKIKRLYRGYHYGMMRAIPFHASCFVIFEILKYIKTANEIILIA
jgi:solute carrier family 25 carnitine/acylcarnitine transporter 20/29